MNYLKISLLLTALLVAAEGNAQSAAADVVPDNSFVVNIDSLQFDIYNNYEPSIPPVNFNTLQEPVLFIVNGKATEISRFSDLKLEHENLKSVTVVQDPEEIKELGYLKYNSVVKIKTEKEE